MKRTHQLAASTLISALLLVTGCEESGSASSGGAELADQPQSMLGKSAASARDVANKARNRDGQTTALADRLAGSGTIEVAGLVFEIPEGWESVAPSNSMRAAQINAGECLLVMSIASGSVDANIDRWAGQVLDASGQPDDPMVEERTVNRIETTLVEFNGTYMEGSMRGPKTERPDYTMLGAIIPQGRSSLFIKLTGPSYAVDDLYDDWTAFINSMSRP